MSAIQFLTTVAKGVRHTLFQSPEALQQVCEKIVLPNIRLRDSDEEIFEMDWVEYVRRDTEGGDADTRRRAASELVKTLTEKFPTEVSASWPVLVITTECQTRTCPESCFQGCRDARKYSNILTQEMVLTCFCLFSLHYHLPNVLVHLPDRIAASHVAW